MSVSNESITPSMASSASFDGMFTRNHYEVYCQALNTTRNTLGSVISLEGSSKLSLEKRRAEIYLLRAMYRLERSSSDDLHQFCSLKNVLFQ